eukprot:jgi/Tetstr1/440659/TSEL_028968.t1
MATSPSSQLPPNRRWDPDELCVLDAGAYEDLEWCVWWDNIRLHHTFTQEQLDGPYGSSTNPRELFMVPMNISQLGPRLRGRIMLLRLDNTAAVGATIKVASSSPEVLRLLWWLVELLQFYDIEIVARHLPGRDNTPADAISRLKGLRDNQD